MWLVWLVVKWLAGLIHVNTAPLSWMLKLWFVLKTSGTELNWRYRTAQLKAAHREKKKTTGSVINISTRVSKYATWKMTSRQLTKWTITRNANHLHQRRLLFITLDLPPEPLHLALISLHTRHNDAIIASGFQLFIVSIQCFGLPAQEDASSGF